MRRFCLLAAAALAPLCARGADLPDATITPGVARFAVTRADLCPVAHTPALRNVSEADKRRVYRSYGMVGNHTGYCNVHEGCEVDHLISLELGGANDIKNLWPEPYSGTPWNAHAKDKLENTLHALVCAGAVTLEDAQSAVATNWIDAYRKYVSAVPH